MPLDFYIQEICPHCRAVSFALEALSLNYNKKRVDPFKGEDLKPEFVKLNPLHTLPTINDGGFVLWESQPIIRYIVDKYAKDDSLYPKDLQRRAIVERMQYFALYTLYKHIETWLYPQILDGQAADPEKEKNLKIALDFLDGFLLKTKFAAGNVLSIADFSLMAYLAFLDIKNYDFSPYTNVEAYIKKMKDEIPYFNVGQVALDEFKTSLEQ